MSAALLLIDLQRDFLAAPGLVPAAGGLIDRASRLLAGCRARRIPVIHVWTTIRRDDDRRLRHWRESNRWQCVEGTAGHAPPDSLRPVEGERIIHKTGFNCFAKPDLAAALHALHCDTVVLAGVHLHACVRAAAVECLERGLEVRVADDAVASNDPIHAAAVRRWLAERCVIFEPVTSVLARFDGGAPTVLVHRSPRKTAEVLFEVPVEGGNGVATAAAVAQEAWRGWCQTSPDFRRQQLEAVARRIEAAAPELARQMAIEIGKPLVHGREEVHRAVANLRDVVRRHAADSRERHEGGGIVRDQPLGVVALISAWNNPVAIPLGKIAPALIYGNVVVWKPAPAATSIARTLRRLIREAGVPEPAVQLLTGDHTTAQRLASEANVDAVTLTGSLQSGYALQEICARRLVPLQAELSGNNAAIIWDDADWAAAAAQVAWGALAFAGQRCTANRRVIVPAAFYERVLHELAQAARRLVWGDPLESSTEIGPVINLEKRDEVAAIGARARERAGPQPVLLPHAAQAAEPWVPAGAYAQPVILGCDEPDDPVVREETMGPVLVVQPAGDFEHALRLCNGVRHGLIAALFTASADRQRQFLAEARAGVLKLNASTAGVDVTLPFGGWKASGIGPPEHGEADRCFYTRLQAVYGTAHEHGEQPISEPRDPATGP